MHTTKMTRDEHVLALSWNIATEPKLYWELALNPYSPKAIQIISERFPDMSITDIIHAVILAEPEGTYDRNFKLLPEMQQEEERAKQKNIANKINERLVSYCKKHAKELHLLPKESLYNSLSFLIFETADGNEIEQRYPQNHRRDLRLAVVNFIEGGQKKYQVRKQPLIIGVFAALVLILSCYLTQRHMLSQTHPQNEKKQVLTISVQKENKRLPVRLIIPSIKVNAFVEYVGLNSQGAMDVPSTTSDVGWYRLGPSPGEIGNAVISGHFDGREGKFGVFNDLDKLNPGDKLYVTNDQGTTNTFVVRTTRIYDPGYADEVFFPNDYGTHLNLITCDGIWDDTKKSYSKRLVVFTDIMH